MKNVCLFLFFCLVVFFQNPSFAEGYGYKYFDNGGIYTNATLPKAVIKDVNNQKSNFVNVSHSNIDLSKLKHGVSSRANVLGLVDVGDGGINKAALNGGITKIYHVDTQKVKVYIPLLFIPIYIDSIETHVYGE